MKELRKIAAGVWRPVTIGAIGVSIVLAFVYALRTAIGDEFAEALDDFRDRHRHAR